jgi:hypothetical protein
MPKKNHKSGKQKGKPKVGGVRGGQTKAPVKATWGLGAGSFLPKVAENIKTWGGNGGAGYGGLSTTPGTSVGAPQGAKPSAPKPPAAPGLTSTPENPIFKADYNSAIGRSRRDLDSAFLGAHENERRAGSDYGFKVSWEAQDVPTDLNGDGTIQPGEKMRVERPTADMSAIDPTNPFSKMALLQRSFEQAKSGTMNGYAGQGQLGSGAYQRMQAENTHNNDRDSQALKQAFLDILAGSRADRTSASNNYIDTNSEAYRALLNAQLGS